MVHQQLCLKVVLTSMFWSLGPQTVHLPACSTLEGLLRPRLLWGIGRLNLASSIEHRWRIWVPWTSAQSSSGTVGEKGQGLDPWSAWEARTITAELGPSFTGSWAISLVPSGFFCLDLCVFVCLSSRLISHNFGDWEVWDQAASMAEFWWRPISWIETAAFWLYSYLVRPKRGLWFYLLLKFSIVSRNSWLVGWPCCLLGNSQNPIFW